MSMHDAYSYYSREDVQQAILRISENREVVGVFRDGGFSTRPNTILYPKDITMLVNSGAVAFHGSLERWSNPMSIGSENYEKGRIGWDLILDLDCEDTEHGKVAAKVLVWALKKHGVKSVYTKFTGGTGFHLGVPFEAFPENIDYRKTSAQYPDIARKTANYIREFMREKFEKKLLEKWSIEELAKAVDIDAGKLMTKDGIDPFRIVDVDPVLISPRHLFRLPYSLHEKSRLVSLPLKISQLDDFRKEDASPEKVRFIRDFLGSAEPGEAGMLVTEAVDWSVKHEKKKKESGRIFRPRKPIPLELAPPCIKKILSGIGDGKKRSVLVLINYLSSLGWSWEKITELMLDWNMKNTPKLGDNYIKSQIRWHENRGSPKPPPNCTNMGYYESFGVCAPDKVCGGSKKTIKNPVNYAMRSLSRKNK